MGWTRGTKHIPNLGLVGCPMGSQGTMGQWDVPGHPTAKLDNPQIFTTEGAILSIFHKEGLNINFIT